MSLYHKTIWLTFVADDATDYVKPRLSTKFGERALSHNIIANN